MNWYEPFPKVEEPPIFPDDVVDAADGDPDYIISELPVCGNEEEDEDSPWR